MAPSPMRRAKGQATCARESQPRCTLPKNSAGVVSASAVCGPDTYESTTMRKRPPPCPESDVSTPATTPSGTKSKLFTRQTLGPWQPLLKLNLLMVSIEISDA